jgi:hypothetical protein
MPTYERLSARQHHLLRTLSRKSAEHDTALELDQRTLGSLFWRGLVLLSADLTFSISALGFRVLESYQEAHIYRENPKAPMSHYITRRLRQRSEAKRSTAKLRLLHRKVS